LSWQSTIERKRRAQVHWKMDYKAEARVILGDTCEFILEQKAKRAVKDNFWKDPRKTARKEYDTPDN